MLFKKKKSVYSENPDILKVCATCIHAKELHSTDDFICDKYGIVSAKHTCKRYFYNRLMKRPKRKRILNSHTPDEFSID